MINWKALIVSSAVLMVVVFLILVFVLGGSLLLDPSGDTVSASDAFVEVTPEESPAEEQSADASRGQIASIKLATPDGRPVPNLRVRLRVAGEANRYIYEEELLTNPAGGVALRVAPGSYEAVVSDKLRDSSEANQMIFPVEVAEGQRNELQLEWTYPTPYELDKAAEKKVTLTFVDVESVPLSSVYVLATPLGGGEESVTLMLGFTDAEGKVYWTNSTPGSYRVEVYDDHPAENGFTVSTAYDVFELEVTNVIEEYTYTCTWSEKLF